MSIGLAFWIVWLILIIFLFALRFGYVVGAWATGLDILVIVLVTLLGWAVFGAPVR